MNKLKTYTLWKGLLADCMITFLDNTKIVRRRSESMRPTVSVYRTGGVPGAKKASETGAQSTSRGTRN